MVAAKAGVVATAVGVGTVATAAEAGVVATAAGAGVVATASGGIGGSSRSSLAAFVIDPDEDLSKGCPAPKYISEKGWQFQGRNSGRGCFPLCDTARCA